MPRVAAYLLTGTIAMSLLAAPAKAQPPGPTTPSEWDRLVIDALKEAHNKGADLYNAGDPAGGFRLYQGALTVARPLLAHRPAVQKLIDDGFADVAKSAGVIKIQAFRLHEVIEQVRSELKKIVKQEKDAARAAEPRPLDFPTKPAEPPAPKPLPPTVPKPQPTATDDTETMPRPVEVPAKPKDTSKTFELPKPADPPAGKLKGASVGGKLTVDGKPAGGAEVTFVGLGTPEPRVATATVNANGLYALDAGLPPGVYAVMVTPGADGAKVPEQFHTVRTSALRANLVAGPNALDLDLKGP